MGLQLGSYNNLKDIPTMWTTGEAAGTAAALCVKAEATPRTLNIATLQAQLRAQGALLSPERIAELEQEKLPTGRTVGQLYEELLGNMRAYWRSRGEQV